MKFGNNILLGPSITSLQLYSPLIATLWYYSTGSHHLQFEFEEAKMNFQCQEATLMT